MSYSKKLEYEIILKDSFLIIKCCPKCNRKTHFKNTKKFRINANNNKLDIWLIYQCKECKHTLNLAIYERQIVSSIPKEEYQYFLKNNEQLAEMYGKNIKLFKKNKAEIDFGKLDYDIVKRNETIENSGFVGQIFITINNPYMLKIRPEKQIAMVLGLSRNQVKNFLDQDKIKLEMAFPQFISIRIHSLPFYMDK